MAKQSNQKIQEDSIRWATDVEAVKKRNEGLINNFSRGTTRPKLEKEVDRLMAGYDQENQTISGLGRFNKKSGEIINDDFDTIKKTSGRQAERIGNASMNFQIKSVKESSSLELGLRKPSRDKLQRIVYQEPFQGHNIDQWFEGLKRKTRADFTTAIKIGMANGDSIPQIKNRLLGTKSGKGGVLGTSTRDANTIARTLTNHVNNQAKESVYKENQDVIKAVEYVATLDDRTSDICMRLDGKIFPVDSGARPPQHPNCRSTTTPVTKSWKELGIPLDEADEGIRASQTGAVPEKTTYGEWLKTQNSSVQNEALGATRARLFRNGQITVDKLTKANQIPRNIKQIEQAAGLWKWHSAADYNKSLGTRVMKDVSMATEDRLQWARNASKLPADSLTQRQRDMLDNLQDVANNGFKEKRASLYAGEVLSRRQLDALRKPKATYDLEYTAVTGKRSAGKNQIRSNKKIGENVLLRFEGMDAVNISGIIPDETNGNFLLPKGKRFAVKEIKPVSSGNAQNLIILKPIKDK